VRFPSVLERTRIASVHERTTVLSSQALVKKLLVSIFVIGGVLLLGCALLVPAHFRAVDAAVVERAGKGSPGASTPTLIEEGVTFLSVEKLGPARMLLQAAQLEGVPRADVLASRVTQFTRDNPSLVAIGGAAPLFDKINTGQLTAGAPKPIVELLARRTVREKTLEFLQQSRRPGVQQILKNRQLSSTTRFPAATTSSGQALDAAILTAALLYQGDYLSASFRDAFEWLATHANRGEDSDALELVYLDLLSLGKRLDWVSLTEFMKRVDDLATLRDLAESMRSHEEAVPQIFSAAVVSENPGAVAKYLAKFPETGLHDIEFALGHGRGAVELVTKQQQRVYYANQVRNRIVGYDPFGAFFYGMTPAAIASRVGTLIVKYVFLLLAAFCIARAIGFITAQIEHRVGMRFAADSVFALAIAFVIAVAVEPFLGSPSQVNFPIRFQLPTLVSAATAFKVQNMTQTMNLSLTSLLVFFVLQALIYIWCLTKLAEIRRQQIEPRLKLRLLDNEDHLFDAGLYVGFVGSVISLILMSIGVGKISMMAYASTSFGIIFVSVLKIFHVRPLKRRLILESEAQPQQP